MSGVPAPADSSADEARLAQQAAVGNGEAFAELYERYAQRAYNLCYRILGSEDDAADATQEAFVGLLRRLPSFDGRDLAFGSYLFTSARHACYDLIDRRRRTEPSDEIPESSIPMGGGVGGGGLGFDPGDPEDDPERNVLLDARQEEIRAANATLPARQREALALKELEELSYDEIAASMGMNRNSVAQLISRARINLRDALRGSALASIAAASPECERALALLAARQDAQPAADAAWLELHLHDCETCRLGREAMEEAGVSYRAWLPIAATPVMFRETMAEAAEAVGADWSDVVARRERSLARGGRGARFSLSGSSPVLAHRRRDLALIGVLALALVAIVFAGATSDDAPPVDTLGAAEESTQEVADEPAEAAKAKPAKKSGSRREEKDGGPKAEAPPGDDPAEQAEEPGQEGPSGTRARHGEPAERAGQTGTGERRQGSGGGSETGGGDPSNRTTTPADPPASDPPASDPPRSDTPSTDPPPPPPEEPPVREPPVREPPVREPPVREPPAGVPPRRPTTPPSRPPAP
jgi:RNA polymerase sigma-70 factor (ECF subfamily)